MTEGEFKESYPNRLFNQSKSETLATFELLIEAIANGNRREGLEFRRRSGSITLIEVIINP